MRINEERENALAAEFLASAKPSMHATKRNHAMKHGAKAMVARLEALNAVSYSRDDKEYSRLFGECIADVAAWVPEEKRYRRYDGKKWAKDADGEMIAKDAKAFADALMIYATTLEDGKEKQDFMKWSSRYARYANRKTLVSDAKSEIVHLRCEFDAHPELLNLDNGTLNTDTMEFRAHDPGDMLTKCACVSYNPGATCEEWESFICEALQDADTVKFFQKQMGVALTCDTSQEKMFIAQGKTRSGKSTALETIKKMLGDDESGYACTSHPSMLAYTGIRDSSRPTPDIARLAGVRFVVMPEAEMGMVLNAARVKAMTGNDSITARNLNEGNFDFRPVYTLVMNTNHLPVVNDQTVFESGRIVVIPFPRHLEEDDQDHGLKARLCTPESLSGILNWCLSGLESYRAEGAKPPTSVRMATGDYARHSDKYGLFFAERMEASSDNCTAGAAYEAYYSWCIDSGFKPYGKQSFNEEMRRRGLFSDKEKVCGKWHDRVILGYRIRRDVISPES